MTTSNPDYDRSNEDYVPVDAVLSDGAASAGDDDPDLSLGERLRKARAKAGYTLDSASARTRIKRDYLEGLEYMDPRALPSRTYAVGYLRTYAQFLGLDADACVARFKAEMEVDAGRATPTAPQEKKEFRLPRGAVGAVLILGGVIAAAGWYGNYVSRSDALAGVSAPMDTLLSGEADGRDAYLEIHAGAGGTESQDWASMLLRMYVRWAERAGFKVDTLEYQDL